MSVVIGGICPHPPIMVPEVGRGRDVEVARSQQAMLELGRRVASSGAEVIVMISPHAPVFRGAVALNASPRLYGDLGQFGASGVKFNLDNDLRLLGELKDELEKIGFPVVEISEGSGRRYGVDVELDHGLMVPLYFLRRSGANLPLLPVSMGIMPYRQLYLFGVAVRAASRRLGRKVALLASGDLSHRLTPDAPAGYDPLGETFEREMERLVRTADVEAMINLDVELVERVGECGLRPIIMMMGAFDGLSVEAEVLSHEWPFGVGYLVASLVPGTPDAGREFARRWREEQLARREKRRAQESFPVRLARRVVEMYTRGQKGPYYDPGEVPPEFRGMRAGVFVSIKKNGQLRGCIGTIAPTKRDVVEEIVSNAISAATRDSRFSPVRPEELDELEYSVDILKEPEPVRGPEDLDPKRYGVIVSSGFRRGLLLPDLEGIDTPEEQIAIACQKAGIDPGEKFSLERFEVVRYY